MTDEPRKLVFAPFGANDYGDDILFFEHALLFALETAIDTAGGFSYADIHAQAGGPDKANRPVPPLSETEARALADRANCDALVDGLLTATRDPETGALTEIEVAPRVYFPAEARFAYPAGYAFAAFDPAGTPSRLEVDYDLLIAVQYKLCEGLLDALGVSIPPAFTTDALQITPSWDAYVAFLKARRIARTPETRAGWYEQAVKADPHFFLALLNAATLARSGTDYALARKLYGQALAETSDPAQQSEIYFELGLCSIYLGDTKTARNFWEQALALGADNPTLYVNMAGTYEQEENLVEAVRLNELAVERFPDYHKAVVNLARLEAMRGHLDRAIELYTRALELSPDDALRRAVLGGCLLAAERPEEAREQFTLAVELDPDSDPGRYAQQELDKLAPPPGDGGPPRKKRFGLF